MSKYAIAFTVLGLISAFSPAAAQQTWAFELRGGAALPTQDLGSDELGTGLGFEGTFRYRFQPHLAAYAGWDWMHFNPSDSFAGTDLDFEETGYVFGLRFEHPLSGESGPAEWVRAGATYDHIEIEDSNGDIIADSGHGFGWEAGAGLAVNVGNRFSVTPGARYRSLARDVEVGTTTTGVDLRYVVVEVGLAFLF